MNASGIYKIFGYYKSYFSNYIIPSILSFVQSLQFNDLKYLYPIIGLYILLNFLFNKEKNSEKEILETISLNHKCGSLATQYCDLKRDFENFAEKWQIKTNQNNYDLKIIKEENNEIKRILNSFIQRIDAIEEDLLVEE
jgi:hypothetical protein